MDKIETHLHTNHVSGCAHLDAETLAAGYQAAGYAALAVTDHYTRYTFQQLQVDIDAPGDKLTPFLEGFHRMEAACAARGIRVFRGAELRFDEGENDYLLYHYPDALLAEPAKIFPLGIEAFAPLARAAGALLVQAHPCRGSCRPAPAHCLDGVEVCNRNPRHQNFNERAEAYAARFGLLRLGGSDCHETEDIGLGGILVRELPEDDGAFVRLIRSGGYTVIGAREEGR